MNPNRLDTDLRIRRLVNEKLGALEELLAVMKDWSVHANREDEEALLENLSKRDAIIERIVLADKALDWLRADQGAFLEVRRDETELFGGIIRQIEALNNEDIRQVRERMDFYISETKRIRRGKSGISAYMRNGMVIPKKRYEIDIKG